MNVLLVAAGGGIGAVLRYLIGIFLAVRLGPDFPWGTFFVNVTGSFLIGIVLVLVEDGTLSPEARLFLAVGILGGYTTFSTYSYEAVQLMANGEELKTLMYIFGQVFACLLGAYLGLIVGRSLLGGT
jgi:fluoride exporter